MVRSRAVRLWSGVCGVLAWILLGAMGEACGFTGLGTADRDSGVGAGGDGARGEGGSANGEGGEIVIGMIDGGADGALDAATDAKDGAVFVCPTGCTSCTGTTCNIDCTTAAPCLTQVVCPPGIPCHIRCLDTNACTIHTLSCADASACRVDCTAATACETTTINCGIGACRVECSGAEDACKAVKLGAGGAASLCLQCRGPSGKPGCSATDAAKPAGGRPCNTSCAVTGCEANGSGLNGCVDIATCP